MVLSSPVDVGGENWDHEVMVLARSGSDLRSEMYLQSASASRTLLKLDHDPEQVG